MILALFAVAFAATKDDLKTDLNKLKQQASSEIAKLKSEGKVALAHEIEVLEKEIHKAEETLEKLHPQTDMGKIGLHALETVIKKLEEKLHNKMKSLGGFFYDSTKDQLIAKAKELKHKSEEAIKKLKQEGKTSQAHEIEIMEKDIDVVEKHLADLSPSTEAGKLGIHAVEMVLRGLEEKLNAKLKSVEGSFYDLKEDLIKDASKLATQAAKAIEKLKSEGKHVLAAEIQLLDNELRMVEKKIHDAHPSTEAGQIALHALESIVKALENKLETKLKSLGGSFYDLKEDLIKDASKLAVVAAKAIEKLKSEGKHVLAAEIQLLDNELHKVEKKIHDAHPTSEAGQIALHALESIVKALETKLEAKLKSIGSF